MKVWNMRAFIGAAANGLTTCAIYSLDPRAAVGTERRGSVGAGGRVGKTGRLVSHL
jgi:hypothetical protein